MNQPAPACFTQPDWKEMLTAVMLRNQAAKVESDTLTGEIRISVPTQHPWYHFPPISWIIHVPEYRVRVLDPLGALVWNLCDGQHTVEDIIRFIAKKHGLTFHESRVSVTTYLKLLIGRGALAVAL